MARIFPNILLWALVFTIQACGPQSANTDESGSLPEPSSVSIRPSDVNAILGSHLTRSAQAAVRQCSSVPCLPNLARTAVVTVSSTAGSSPSQPDSRWTKERAVDGNRDSLTDAYGWSSMALGSESSTEWIQFDLGSQRSFNEVQLYARNDLTYGTVLGDGFPRDFVIEVSQDGASWTSVVTQTDYPSPQTELQAFTFPGVSARFLRVRATRLDLVGGSYYLQLAEIEIYDNPGQVAFTFSTGEQVQLSLAQGAAITFGDVFVGNMTELDGLFTGYQTYLNQTPPASLTAKNGRFTSLSAGVGPTRTCAFWFLGCWKWQTTEPRWPDRTVYYDFDRGVTALQAALMNNIISDWNSRSSVQWIQDGSRSSKVRFKVEPLSGGFSGFSSVGRVGSTQYIRIDPNYVDSTQTVQHEMGHATGLIHEQQRCDRDDYVSVTSTDTVNYGKLCGGPYTLLGPYDYSSLMHYWFIPAFLPQRVGSVGNASLTGGSVLGCYDRLGINKLYGVAGGPLPSAPDAAACNASRSATVTVSSTTGPSATQPDSRWTATGAVDGQRNSISTAYGWSSMASGSPATVQWIQFQFSDQRRVSRVDVYPRNDATYSTVVGDGFPVDFTIDLSNDGTTWTTVVSRTGYPRPSSVQTFEFTAQPARYLRVRATNLRSVAGGSYYFQIAEIETF